MMRAESCTQKVKSVAATYNL